MIENEARPDEPDADHARLSLAVGCTFGLSSVQPVEAIMQVAPRPHPEL
jgi:hypothetical protein